MASGLVKGQDQRENSCPTSHSSLPCASAAEFYISVHMENSNNLKELGDQVVY